MYKSAKVIQFIGPPCSGKTAISKIVEEKIRQQNFRVFYLDKKPEQGVYSRFSDKILKIISFFLVFIFSLSAVSKLRKIGLKNNLAWIRRFCSEWHNSIISRRYLLSIISQYDYVIADHCLESMYLFELADPRNILGLKLYGLANYFMKYFPAIKIENSFFVYAAHDVLKERLKYKSKEVRSGLSDEQKDIFFRTAIELLNKLKTDPIPAHFSKNYKFIDTSSDSLDDTVKKVMMDLALLSDPKQY